MLKRKQEKKLSESQKEILDLQNQIQEEMSYIQKLQMKFLKNKDNWFRYGKNQRAYWMYLGGKIEKAKDDNQIENHRFLNDNRHFLKDPIVQELEATRSSIGYKEELIKVLEGKPIALYKQEEYEEDE